MTDDIEYGDADKPHDITHLEALAKPLYEAAAAMFADVPEGSMRNFNIAANATAAATTALMNVMPEPMEGDADLDPEFISRRYATIVQAIVNLMAVDFCCLGHSVETISQIASLVLEKLPRHVDLRAEAAASGDLQSMPCQGKA